MRKNNVVVVIKKAYDYPKGMLSKQNTIGDALENARVDFIKDFKKGDVEVFEKKVYEYYPLYKENLQPKRGKVKDNPRQVNNNRLFEGIIKELLLLRNKEKYGNEVISYETTPDLFKFSQERYEQASKLLGEVGAKTYGYILSEKVHKDQQNYINSLWDCFNNAINKEYYKLDGIKINDVFLKKGAFDVNPPNKNVPVELREAGRLPEHDDEIDEEENEGDEWELDEDLDLDL